MKTNQSQRSVKIICEIHPQHLGSMNEIERMIMQSKIGGADYVKLQLYDSEYLFNNKDRNYLEISSTELKRIKSFSDQFNIEIFASVFDKKSLNIYDKIGFKTYKIASRTVNEEKFCKEILKKKKETFISMGMYDYEKKGFPYKNFKNAKYFYCVSKYPTRLDEINMPDFNNSNFVGYSDHTIGISACIYAISRGAKIIEKHFSNNHSLNVETQLAHVCSMNFEQLCQLRLYADSISLLRS